MIFGTVIRHQQKRVKNIGCMNKTHTISSGSGNDVVAGEKSQTVGRSFDNFESSPDFRINQAA